MSHNATDPKPSTIRWLLRLGMGLAVAVLLFPGAAQADNNNPRLVGGPGHPPPLRPHPLHGGAPGNQGADTASPQQLPNIHFNYYGGRVVSNIQVVQVLWGPGNYLPEVTGTGVPSIASFYQTITNSSYIDSLDEYNTTILDVNGNPGTNQTIGRGQFVGQYTIAPSAENAGPTVTDQQIQSELGAQIAAGSLPAPTTDSSGNVNTYYAVFFPSGTQISLSGDLSCRDFCAYHGSFVPGGGSEIYYGVHPDQQAGSGCDLLCGLPPFESETTNASDEMVETITDAEDGLATTPLAWYDPDFGEIADVCFPGGGRIVGSDGYKYTVTTKFSNEAGACIVDKTPGFTLDAPLQSAGACAPVNVQYRVDTQSLFGFTDPITLSTESLPAGVTATFDPNPIAPGQSSVLTVDVTPAAPIGLSYFNVVGTSGNAVSKFVPLSLVIATAPPGGTSIVSPHDGATDLIASPVFRVKPARQGFFYEVDIATDPKFKNIVNGGSADQLFSTAQNALVPVFVTDLAIKRQYYARAVAQNPCGVSTTRTQSFNTLNPMRLGNNTEDITFVPSGPLKNTIAILDGDQVLGMRTDQPPGTAKVHELFRTTSFGIAATGMSYLDAEQSFVLIQQGVPFLFVFDSSGQLTDERFTSATDGAFTEGVVALPANAPQFGNDLLIAANRDDPSCASGVRSSLEVVSADGHGVATIKPQDPLGCQYVAGLGYQAPNHLLVSPGATNQIWTIDFSGNVIGSPAAVPGAVDVEGIVQISTGQVVAADYAAGQLSFLTTDLSPVLRKGGDYPIGVGQTGTYGLAWNSDQGQYLVTSLFTRGSGGRPASTFLLSSVDQTLHRSMTIADPPSLGFSLPVEVTYLPNERSVAVGDVASQSLAIFTSGGTLHDTIDLSSLGPNAGSLAVEYLPPQHEFAVQPDFGTQLAVISRNGQSVGSIATFPATADGAAAFYAPNDPSGGRLLLYQNDFGDGGGLFSVDLKGLVTPFGIEFHPGGALGLVDDPQDLATITSGPQAGKFVAVDFRTSSLVIFSVE